MKQIGLRLWAENGPGAPRCLAAIDYVVRMNDCMPPPTGRDWAARSLEFAPPNGLARGTFSGAPNPIPAISQRKASTSRGQELATALKQTAPGGRLTP